MRKKYLTIDQVIHEILPCYTKDAVYKLTQRKQIPHYKIGRKLVFREDEVARWMEQYHVKENVDGLS